MNWQDGLLWGKVIDEFTFQRLHQIIGVMQDEWLGQNDQPAVVIGFDTRFGSDVSARVCAQVLASKGIKVFLANTPIPLGALFLATKRNEAYGIMVTGGSRPIEYNGLRLIHRSGRGLTRGEWLDWSARLINYPFIEQLPFQEAVSRGTISFPPLFDDYITFLRETVECEQLKRSELRVVFDSLYGSSQGVPKHLMFSEKMEEIHDTRHSMFGGLNPSFEEGTLQQLWFEVTQKQKHLGILYDPEGRDWIFLNAKNGQIKDGHRIVPLLKPLADKKSLHHIFPEWTKDGILCSLLFLELIVDK